MFKAAVVPVGDLLPGDVIRYLPGPFEDGEALWLVVEIGPDVSRPAGTSWRLVAQRFEGEELHCRAGDHPVGDEVELVWRL